METKLSFEEIIMMCMNDPSLKEEVIRNSSKYEIDQEELELLKETDFEALSFNIDERNALHTLSMWAATV